MNLNPKISSDFNTAIHEGGHAVCAAAFRIPAYPEILHDGKSVATQTTHPTAAGLTSFDDGPMTPFQLAVICWGGPLAEALFGAPPDWFPPYKPTALLLKDWFSAMTTQIKRFSDGDRAGIQASYKNSWRACKSAFQIVRKNRARIHQLAKAIAGRVDGSKQSGVPRPPHFPATHAEFLKLICGNSAANFENFLTCRAQNELAAGMTESFDDIKQSMLDNFLRNLTDAQRAGHPGKTDSEIAEILFDKNLTNIVASQRRIYGGSFDAPSWTAAALDYRAWAAGVKN